MMLVRVH